MPERKGIVTQEMENCTYCAGEIKENLDERIWTRKQNNQKNKSSKGKGGIYQGGRN